MGKNLHQEEPSSISLDNRNPGCKWGILHHFHNHKRHHAKKRLTHKRNGSEEHINDAESTIDTLEAAKMQEYIDSVIENPAVETKTMDPAPAHKSSMKSRIKALVEMPKRKGRHRRSASEPMSIQLDRTPSFNRLEPSDLEPRHDVHSVAIPDPELPKFRDDHVSNNGSCDLCATIDNRGLPTFKDHTLLHEKFIHAVDPRKNASVQGSKLFLDALDLLEMRKEVFLKMMEDPRSSLTHQLHSRRKPHLRSGLTKSMSFPATRSIYRRAVKTNYAVTKKEDDSSSKEKHESNGSPMKFGRELEPSDTASPTSTNMVRKHHGNKGSFKHFKNLREKIKHVIRERKKEKNHIIRDGILHKVPYGSKDIKEDNHMNQELKPDKFPRSSCGSDQLGSDHGRNTLRNLKKTSSFNDSFDRYDQLLETRFNRDSKYNAPDRVRFRNANTLSPSPSTRATFGRILSLPDLRSYSYFQIDDSPSTSCTDTPVRISSSVESSRISEQKPLKIGSQNRMPIFSISESGSEDNFVDVGESFDDSSDSQAGENATYHDLNLEPGLISLRRPSKSDLVSDIDSNYQDYKNGQKDAELAQRSSNLNASTASEDGETSENQVEQSYSDLLLRLRMDMKDKPEFSYLKDVLELSGFSRNEILGKWHSEDHPINPLVFEVVEGCLVPQPESPSNEEDVSCDHLLLSDLINEVLLNIYERSFCSWPKPLTCRSNIHRMPVGYHVLEEVWAEISWLLSWKPEDHQTIDDGVCRDLEKGDGWMSLQFDAECVGLEVEDLIFDDLLEEIIFT